MPGNPRAIVAEAELKFPVRIVIRVPEAGIGTAPQDSIGLSAATP
jgi:hypothetical protein